MKSGIEIEGIPPLILLYKQVTLFFGCVIGTVLPSADVSKCNHSRSAVMMISFLRIKEKKKYRFGKWLQRDSAGMLRGGK